MVSTEKKGEDIYTHRCQSKQKKDTTFGCVKKNQVKHINNKSDLSLYLKCKKTPCITTGVWGCP